MNYATLTTSELVDRAKATPQFNADPLFTAVVARLEFVCASAGDGRPAPHYNTRDADVRG